MTCLAALGAAYGLLSEAPSTTLSSVIVLLVAIHALDALPPAALRDQDSRAPPAPIV